ncbi:cytochrome b/b6 domain-containing protein [uncultured Paracoccus sp.]|uniref:cytochrome b/b6 domain-containing protein n=1 Tax=uncultured Paracoccus sp. TaxID=189685 RepID=UPI0025FD840B|nr:cytochrome b/b6 domain-containing protein [uncultured Paracoccus sp.]
MFPARAESVEWTAALAGAPHGELAWLMAALILGHVVMAGLHRAMWRDGTLSRMAGTPRKA